MGGRLLRQVHHHPDRDRHPGRAGSRRAPFRLVPTDPTKGGTAGATIKDGKFTADVPVGELRVEISAPKVVGKRKAYDTPDSPTVDIVEDLIPARYNVNSELKVTVKKGGQKETFTSPEQVTATRAA